MFWNKDKIPDYINNEEDLFKFDDGTIIENDEKSTSNKYNTHVNLEEDFSKKKKKEKIKQEKREKKVKERMPKEKKTKTKKEKVRRERKEFNREKAINDIVNIVLVITFIVAFMIIFDVVRATRYGILPVFANHQVSNENYDLYNGIGYKVYYYHIKNGKNVIEVGNNSLKYNDKAIKTNTYDLSLLYHNDFDKFVNNYLNKYVNISGKLYKKEGSKVYLKYSDSDNKYETLYVCSLMHNRLVEKEDVTVKGMLDDYDKDKNIIYINNCSVK